MKHSHPQCPLWEQMQGPTNIGPAHPGQTKKKEKLLWEGNHFICRQNLLGHSIWLKSCLNNKLIHLHIYLTLTFGKHLIIWSKCNYYHFVNMCSVLLFAKFSPFRWVPFYTTSWLHTPKGLATITPTQCFPWQSSLYYKQKLYLVMRCQNKCVCTHEIFRDWSGPMLCYFNNKHLSCIHLFTLCITKQCQAFQFCYLLINY